MNELMPLFSVSRNLRKNRSDPVHWVMDQEAAKYVAVASALLSSACDSQLQKWFCGCQMSVPSPVLSV